MTEATACRSCGSTALDDLGACTPYAGAVGQRADAPDPGRLLRCRACGLGQRHPIPDTETLIEMYRDTPAEDMDYRFEDNAAWSLARKRLMARFSTNDAPAVLDVGCHTGAFLAGLPPEWRRHGIESAREPLCIARERHGVTIIAERLESVEDHWARKFDIVTMFDVVEHLPDPAAGIAQAARMLKPGGVMMLSSGDLDAWTWRWLGSGHWYLQTPQHLSVISRRFLEQFAPRHALVLADVARIPHRHSARSARLGEGIEAIYWGMRVRRGAWRLPHRLLQSLPGLRRLRHLQRVPWTMTLSDHMVASLAA